MHWQAVALALCHAEESTKLFALCLLLLDAFLVVGAGAHLQFIDSFLLSEYGRVLLNHLVELEDAMRLSDWNHLQQVYGRGQLCHNWLSDGLVEDILDGHVQILHHGYYGLDFVHFGQANVADAEDVFKDLSGGRCTLIYQRMLIR